MLVTCFLVSKSLHFQKLKYNSHAIKFIIEVVLCFLYLSTLASSIFERKTFKGRHRSCLCVQPYRQMLGATFYLTLLTSARRTSEGMQAKQTLIMIWHSDIWKNHKGLNPNLLKVMKVWPKLRNNWLAYWQTHCFNPSPMLATKGILKSSILCHYWAKDSNYWKWKTGACCKWQHSVSSFLFLGASLITDRLCYLKWTHVLQKIKIKEVCLNGYCWLSLSDS